MRQRIHIFLAGLVVLAWTLPAAAQALNGQATVNGAVSIRLPAGWTISTTVGGHTLVAATPTGSGAVRDKDGTGEFQAQLSITADHATALNAQNQQDLVARNNKSYKVVEAPAEITIGGVKGWRFGGTFSADSGAALRARQYMFLVNEQLYVITFTALSSRWAAYAPVVEASVDTFAAGKK